MKESAKDVVSEGVESAKETGSKVADKARGNICFSVWWILFLGLFTYWFYFLNGADMKDKTKDTASEGLESAKEKGSKIADKGRGILNTLKMGLKPFIGVNFFHSFQLIEAKESAKETGSKIMDKGRGKF